MGITIRDIAAKANVSPATVSRVINNSGYVSEANRRKVNKVIKEVNYVPSALAKGLSLSSTNVIGVMIPEIDNPFFSGIIKGISAAADEENLSIILCNTEESSVKEEKMLQVLRGQCIRGLLVSTAVDSGEQEEHYTQRFEQMGIPIVVIDREITGADYDGVFVDDTKALFDLTNLLLRAGHRDIAVLAGNPRLDLCHTRVNGYKKAFRVKGIKHDNANIYYGEFTKTFGYEKTKMLLSTPPAQWPTAILSTNNMLSLGALRAIYEAGLKIPDDIGFAGYDQLEETKIFNIRLTLAERDTQEMGRLAMTMLAERIKQGDAPDVRPYKTVLSATVVVRGSEQLSEKVRSRMPKA